MIYLLHGPEDLLRAERIAALRAVLGPAEMADLSATWLDGRKVSISELIHHADALPFLTPRRLVVVEELLAQLDKRLKAGKSRKGKSSKSAAQTDQEQLLAYLPAAPESTDLVLVESKVVGKRDAVHKLLIEMAREKKAEIAVCEAPPQQELAGWVTRRVQQKGATIERAAAHELATFVGRNLRLLDNELEKLISYRAGEGPIRREDVRLLVPYAQEANIFDMVDAIGRREGAVAVRLLRELLRDGAAPLYLLAMIVRQFRILIQVADQIGQGLDKFAIAKAIGLHPFPTGKAMQQVRQWRLSELEAVYDRLLETDLAIKTGKLPDDLALDLLVVELSQRSGGMTR